MKKFLFFLPLFLLADIDPFSAGDLNSPNPYGLTPTEKAILNNKQEINKVKKDIYKIKKDLKKIKSDVASKLVRYDEIIDDLKNKTSSMKTIINEIDNLNNRIDKVENNLSFLEKNLSDLQKNYVDLNNKYDKLKETLTEMVKIQNENFKYLTSTIENLVNQMKNLNISPKSAFRKAKKLFYAGKLNEAKNLFLISLNDSYMPATSSFYLGEIAYKQKKYKEALAYYKKSIKYYPKKTYFTARLLYHTGMAFEKLGKDEEAKIAFKKLIRDFKNSKYAILAKKELEKLR